MGVSAAAGRHRFGWPGTVLVVLAAWPVLPFAQTPYPVPVAGDRELRVARGDTLAALARTHLDPAHGWRALQRLNRVADPRRLPPGRTLRLPAAWLKAEPAVAEALHVRGDVTVERAGGAPQPVQAGASLQTGDRLHAGADSSLTLRFADGARLLLRPGSTLLLSRLLQRPALGTADTGLRLDQGSADSRVPPTGPAAVAPGPTPTAAKAAKPEKAAAPARRYEITTPTVHLGVRGTEFRTRVDSASATTHVEVLEGQVATTSGRIQHQLAAGQGVVATAGAMALSATALAPAPDLAAVVPRLERVPLRVSWPAREGVAAWQAQVVDPEQPDRLLLDGRFDAPTARWPDLPDGRYELRVRAVGPAGLEGIDARRPFVLKARPFPPFTTQPRAGAALRGEAARFGWTLAEGVARYRLQLLQLDAVQDPASADFGAPLADRTGLEAATHEEALPPGRYAWRIASVRPDGDQGPFGDPQAFTLRPLPPAPAMQPPEVGADALVLRWPAGEAGDRYELQLATEATFSAPLQALETREPEVTLPRPGPGRYFVRVRTVDADGIAGPYGGTQLIDVPHSRWWWLVPAGLLLLVL